MDAYLMISKTPLLICHGILYGCHAIVVTKSVADRQTERLTDIYIPAKVLRSPLWLVMTTEYSWAECWHVDRCCSWTDPITKWSVVPILKCNRSCSNDQAISRLCPRKSGRQNKTQKTWIVIFTYQPQITCGSVWISTYVSQSRCSDP